MLGEIIRILAVAGEVGRDHYPTTLFAQSEALVGLHREKYHLRR